MPKNNLNIEQEALSLIKQEKTAWETATAFVTEKVAFNMRNLIRQLRKNYWGIFDYPNDPQTGRKKIWIPLTESLCESVIKNIDLDTKDINFRAKKPKSIGLVSLIRNIVKNYLDETYFGEDLDIAERQIAIDGTIVWKLSEEYDPILKKKIAKRRLVDLLNFYIDPVASSIQETESIIERAVISIDEFKSMKEWINKEEITGSTQINKNDETLTTNDTSNVKMVEIFERWGKMPKYLITNNPKDEELIEGQIVASGTNGKWVLHYIAENKKELKPYEECWYTRVPGRWYGKGIAEKVLMLQLWINTIVNIRINRSYLSQLGIFKIKQGSGITPQMLSKLPANGAIVVNNIDDIQQFVMQEASQASYKDEDIIQNWAERLTSAFEIVTGETLPASMPATNASIQSRSAQSSFVLVKEGIGMFLQRYIKRHLLPLLTKQIKKDEIIRMTGELDELRAFDERIVDEMLYNRLEEINNNGGYIDPQQIELERQRALDKLTKMGKDRYVNLLQNIDFTEYDTQVYITNEEIDKGVLTQNLISMLNIVPEYKDQIVRQIFDIMGLDSNQFKQSQMMQPQGQPSEIAQKITGASSQSPSQSFMQSMMAGNLAQ